MNEIKSSLPKKGKQKLKSVFIFIFLAIIVSLLAWYYGNILFGTRGYNVLKDLYTQKKHLQKQVKKMQEQNSILQKEYFELIGLDPSYKEGKL